MRVEVMKKKRVRYNDTYGEKYETVEWLECIQQPETNVFIFRHNASVSKGDRLILDGKVMDVVGVTEDIGTSTIRVFTEANAMETSLMKIAGTGCSVEYGKAEPSATKDHDAEMWMDSWVGTYARNIVAHYDKIKNGKHIGDLFGLFDLNVACACVGAGPSLDKNIEGLRGFPGIIICADRAYRSLNARGINPDIVFSVDCHDDLIAEMLKGPDSSKDFLVLNTCSDPKVMMEWKGKVMFFNMRHPGVQFTDYILPELFPGFGTIDNCGNVGNESVLLADYIGLSPIVLVGQDYGYTGGKMHADKYEFDADGKPCGIVPVDHAKLMDERTGKVKIGDVITYAAFPTYAGSLYIQQERRGLAITNCTEGGILTGLPCKPLSEMCAELNEQISLGKLKSPIEARGRLEALK